MKYNEPTIKDVREILLSIGTDRSKFASECRMYNDRGRDNEFNRFRRIKICDALNEFDMGYLSSMLHERFPAHEFAVGHYLAEPLGGRCLRYTTIQIVLFKGKYRDYFPEEFKKEVTLTIEDIAELAGCRPDEVKIVK